MKIDSRRAALLVLMAVSIAYHGARVYLSTSALVSPGTNPGAPFKLEAPSRRIEGIEASAAAAGLRVGDEVLRVGDRTLRSWGILASPGCGARTSPKPRPACSATWNRKC